MAESVKVGDVVQTWDGKEATVVWTKEGWPYPNPPFVIVGNQFEPEYVAVGVLCERTGVR